MALSKSKKHFVGLIWADGEKKGGLAKRCDKSECRGAVKAYQEKGHRLGSDDG